MKRIIDKPNFIKIKSLLFITVKRMRSQDTERKIFAKKPIG